MEFETVVRSRFSCRTFKKKKVTKKHYPPDIMAIKVLFDKYFKTYSEEISSMSDEELIAERERLLKALKEENNGTF